MILAPILTPHGLLTLRPGGAGVGPRARLAAGEGVCTGGRAWTFVARRQRIREGSACGALVLAGVWDAIRDRIMCSSFTSVAPSRVRPDRQMVGRTR